MKRFKPVRNRSYIKLKRKQGIRRSSANAVPLVGHSIKEGIVICGTIIKKP